MKKINGKLNLSKIPKRLIKTDSKGNSYIYIDVIETRNEKLRSNNCTHTMELWDKEERKNITLAFLEEKEIGPSSSARQGQAQDVPTNSPFDKNNSLEPMEGDLPF